MDTMHPQPSISFDSPVSSVEWSAATSRQWQVPWGVLSFLCMVGLFSLCATMQVVLNERVDKTLVVREELGQLPRGEVLKPMLLGFDGLGADLLWLNIIQVLGEQEDRASDYEWLAHALDVVTTLDPQYVYAYDIGGVALAELAGRVDWSNALLEKGIVANPQAWRLPFQVGFNAFFHQHDYVRAAEYMALAARLPGRPAYVPELAARLYVEGKQPATALQFLDVMAAQTQDQAVLAVLERRRGEVIIERDVEVLDGAVNRYTKRTGHPPSSLHELVKTRLLPSIPAEPFGGSYQYDVNRQRVISSTHPQRMHLHRAPDATLARLP
ncbi:MAG TPA: hypothetical protein VF443_14330 [Nitrospira sp.]